MKSHNLLTMGLCLCLLAAPALRAYGADESGLVDIHGFISQGYLYTTNNNWMGESKQGTWEFNELGLNFTSMVTSRLRLGMQFFARDLSIVGNDEMTIDWAYADYYIRDWLGIRVGQMKLPMGLYNETRDIDFLRNSVFLPQTIYSEALRDSFLKARGAGLYGNIDVGGLGMLRYQALLASTHIDTEGGTGRVFEEQIMTGILKGMEALGLPAGIVTSSSSDLTGIEVDKEYSIALEWAMPAVGLRIGGTFTRLDYTIDATYSLSFLSVSGLSPLVDEPLSQEIRQEIWTASIEYTWYDLLFSAEFLRSYYSKNHLQSWYALASYRLFDWFALGFYYSENYNNDSDKSGRDPSLVAPFQAWNKTWAFFARLDFNENWLMKAEYQYNNGASMLSRADNLNSLGQLELNRCWEFLACKVTFNF